MSQDFNIFVTSNRMNMAEKVIKSLFPYKAQIFNGNGYESFAKMFNKCIFDSSTEFNIIVGDKAMATPKTIEHILRKVKEGYALVAACGFACVGFDKDLFRRIGTLDERFIGGTYEDSDFLTRLKENNIGFYYSWECEYIKMPSSWNTSENKQRYIEKWGTEHIALSKRLLPDICSNYDYGEALYNKKYLDFSKTVCSFLV